MARPNNNDKHRYCQLAFWVIFWVWTLFGFVADDVFTPLRQYRSLLMWTMDVAMVTLACWVVRERWVWVTVAGFVGMSWVGTCLINHETVFFWLNGLREFIGLLLVYPVMRFVMGQPDSRQRFLDTFDRQGLYFLLVQAFCITVQFIMHGSGDLVGGSYGRYFSGQVSVLIYLVSFFLLRRRLDHNRFLYSLGQNKVYLLLLLPTFLNETKVSFVMLALYVLLLIPADRRFVLRVALMLPLVVLLTWVAMGMYRYSTDVNRSGVSFESMDDVVAYFLADDIEKVQGAAMWEIDNNRGVADVPRMSKLIYLGLLNEQEPGHITAGFGIGQFKGGSQMAVSQFAKQYDWLLMGSVPYLFHIFIQLGLMGIVMLQVYWVLLALQRPAWSGARDISLQLMLLAVVLLIYIYNDMLRNLAFCMVFFTLFAASWLPKKPAAQADTCPAGEP